MPEKQRVVSIDTMPRRMPRKSDGKSVASNQKAIDALPLNSGTWRVKGERGLYLRARRTSKSFFMQRRVRGSMIKVTLGEMSLKSAREECAKRWGLAEPKPTGGYKTFADAFAEFLDDGGKHGELAAKTRTLYQYNLNRYLAGWKDRALQDIGNDEECGRVLYRHLKKTFGLATASQVVRLANAVYRHAREVNRKLPEAPTAAVNLPQSKSRDWALSPEELKAWWKHTQKNNKGEEITLGVSVLNPIKRMWWLACLLTGARRQSVECLRWEDIDSDKKVVRFMVTKGNRPYMVPMSDTLADLLLRYRQSGEIPPSEWVFPSTVRSDHHIVDVRDDKRGVTSAHHMRHSYRTTLAQLGASSDQSHLLMGHSLAGSVSTNYITSMSPALVESLRVVVNSVSDYYVGIIGDLS